MSWLEDLPLKRKLTLVILTACSAVLLLACATLAVYEILDFRRTMTRDATVLADVIGTTTQAALAFEDADAARKLLVALQAEPDVIGARLFGKDGAPFADYARAGVEVAFPAAPRADGGHFERDGLVLFRPVLLDGKRLGTIHLLVDAAGMYERLGLFAGISALVLIGSILLAIVLSARLQRPISGPILALASTAKLVAERKDYSVRAPPQGRNEIGTLTDAFNDMLTQIHGQLMRLDLLHRITRAIGERLDLPSIFQVVIRSLEDNLPMDLICICMWDPAANTVTVSNIGLKSEALATQLGMTANAAIPIDQNGLSRCLRGQLVYEPDVSQVAFPFPQRLAQGGLRALVAAPLLVESKVFGVLLVARRGADSFSSGDCEFLRQLSEHIALAAHQAQLYGALQQAYEELRQTQQAVMQQERLRALGQMASGIAHDINNAISPVALYTESLLETEPGLSPRARNYLETIKRAIEDVAHTVARMREFYRQREPQLTLAPVDLNQMVQQVMDLTRARWSDMPQQRGIVVKATTELAPGLPGIMAVASEVREALINLVFNAIDAMPEGGELTVRTGLAAARPDDSSARQAMVEVVDTGVGMDEATRRRCLEPFFTTKGERGTGLGLAMVYGVMQRHNGDVEIESSVGKGTVMRLVFAVGSAAAGAEAVVDAGPPPSRLRLLVVDDDPLLLKSLRDTLEGDGHIIVTANQGQAGIDAFRAAQQKGEVFAAVITDLGMPYVDGRKVASTIKQASPSTPIIMLTGWGQRLVAEGDVPPHVDCVLNKPPKLRDLRQALARLCRPVAAGP